MRIDNGGVECPDFIPPFAFRHPVDHAFQNHSSDFTPILKLPSIGGHLEFERAKTTPVSRRSDRWDERS